jgi:hypothetical protein
VILPAIRRAFLASVPAGTPLLIVAPEAMGYAALVAQRGDPAVALRSLAALEAGAPLGVDAIANVLLEGLDELAAPVEALQRLRAQAPRARLHALVANAAHLAWLGAFFNGEAAPPGGHLLVRAEIEPLLRAGGWETQNVNAIADAQFPPPEAVPVEIAAGAIRFQLTAAPILQRGRTAGFLVAAVPG